MTSFFLLPDFFQERLDAGFHLSRTSDPILPVQYQEGDIFFLQSQLQVVRVTGPWVTKFNALKDDSVGIT